MSNGIIDLIIRFLEELKGVLAIGEIVPHTVEPVPAVSTPVVSEPLTMESEAEAVVTAPPEAAVAPVASDELDSQGLPWDNRIHSSGKTKYKKKSAAGEPAGAWIIKKGIEAPYVAQVKTELRGIYAAPVEPVIPVAAPVEPVIPVVPVVPVAAPVVPVIPPVVAPVTPVVPVIPVAPVTPVVPVIPVAAPVVPVIPVATPVIPVAAPVVPVAAPEAYGTCTTWGDMMRKIVERDIDKTVVDAECVKLGVANIAELQNHRNLIPPIAQAIGITS